ncbi:MAG: T9SS type A sorting domain-containing protein [Bacteroidota bacterium]
MKKIILPFLCFFTSYLFTHAQSYQPIAVEGAHWIGTRSQGNEPAIWWDYTHSFSIRGDSVLHQKHYKKLYYDIFHIEEYVDNRPYQVVSSELIGLIRDDSTQKKVYYYPVSDLFYSLEAYCPNDKEFLLFDFDLSQGDTLTWCNLDYIKVDQDTSFVVDSITVEPTCCDYEDYFQKDSVIVLHTYGWFPIIFGLQFPSEQRIIEGLGYENYGILIADGLHGGYYCVGTDVDCGIVTSNKNIYKSQIKMYPNPSSTFIRFEGTPLNATAKIYNLNGILQLQNQESVLDISSLAKGIYLVEVTHKGQIIWRDKFLKL